MATVTTNFTVDPVVLPYIGPAPFGDQWASAIPSAELMFPIVTQSITIATGGKDQLASIFCNLPGGWAYAFLECNMSIFGGDSANWDSCAKARMVDGNTSNNWRANFDMCSGGLFHAGTASPGQTYQIDSASILKKIIIPPRDNFAQFTVNVMNINLDESAVNLDFFARFLRFDINQAHLWAVNTPVPVR